jgi:hypothetical protein
MALKTSVVYRCLEKKTLVFGFEIVDLFIVFSCLAALNFLMRGLPYKFFLSWGPAATLALGLRLGKRGKPENYLLHLARSHLSPLVFSAFPLGLTRSVFNNKPIKKLGKV